MKWILFVFFGFQLAGCGNTAHWVKSGVDSYQTRADLIHCRSFAYSNYQTVSPQSQTSYHSGTAFTPSGGMVSYSGTTVTSNGGFSHGFSSGLFMMGQAVAVADCMRQKGYSDGSEGDLAVSHVPVVSEINILDRIDTDPMAGVEKIEPTMQSVIISGDLPQNIYSQPNVTRDVVAAVKARGPYKVVGETNRGMILIVLSDGREGWIGKLWVEGI